MQFTTVPFNSSLRIAIVPATKWVIISDTTAICVQKVCFHLQALSVFIYKVLCKIFNMTPDHSRVPHTNLSWVRQVSSTVHLTAGKNCKTTEARDSVLSETLKFILLFKYLNTHTNIWNNICDCFYECMCGYNDSFVWLNCLAVMLRCI